MWRQGRAIRDTSTGIHCWTTFQALLIEHAMLGAGGQDVSGHITEDMRIAYRFQRHAFQLAQRVNIVRTSRTAKRITCSLICSG